MLATRKFLLSGATNLSGFSRASAGSFRGSNGLLQSAATNAPRFEYAATATTQTNYVRNSSATGCKAGTIGGSGVLPTNWSLTLPTGITATISGVGQHDNLPCVDIRFFGTPTSSAAISLFFEAAGTAAIATAQSQPITFALNAAMIAGNMLTCVGDPVLSLLEISASGASLVTGTQSTGPLTHNSLAEQRFSYYRSISAGACFYVRPSLSIQPSQGFPLDLTIRVGAPQVEKNIYATAWISTSNGAVSQTTRLPLGLLMEPQRTNLLARSYLFTTSWALISTAATTTTLAPDGSTNATQLTTGNISGTFGFYTFFTTAASSVYTVSLYVKYVSGAVKFKLGSDSPSYGYAYFNVATQTVVSTGTAVIGTSITDAGNGWYRYSVTWTTSGTSSSFVFYNADTVGGVSLVWGAQAELGYYVSSFIQTNGAAVTRSADIWAIPATPATNYNPNSALAGGTIGTPGTLPTNVSQAGSCGIVAAVKGFGTEAGIPYMDLAFVGTATAGVIDISFTNTNSMPAVTGQTWVFSQYTKQVSGDFSRMTSVSGVVYEINSSYATVVSSALAALPIGATTLDTLRGAYLYTTVGGATTAFLRQGIRVTLTAGAVNFVLRIGGPQAELATSASDFVLTSGAAVTDASWFPMNTLTRTNLLKYSLDLSQTSAWTQTLVTVTTGATDPTGGTGAVTITAAASGDCYIQQAPAVVANALYVGSVWLRTPSGTVTLNLGAGVTAKSITITTTWTRFWVAGYSSTTTGLFQIGGASTFTGSSVIQAYGAQYEVGNTMSALIHTTAAAVTVADTAPGTLAIEYDLPSLISGYAGVLGGVAAATGFEDTTYVAAGGGGAINGSVRSNRFAITGGTVTSRATPSKLVLAYDSATMQIACNGTASSSTGLQNSLPSSIIRLTIGCSPWGLDNQPGGHIRAVRFWPYKKTGNALLALSL